jgi:hypothetical protein
MESNINGEATVVELAPGRYLFALLSNSGAILTHSLAQDAWRNSLPRNPDETWAIIEAKRESIALPEGNYPPLVTFTDINDPKSVLEVKPDDLAATFGPGYSFKSVTLEITDEPVTEDKIKGLLKWFDDKNLILIDWQKFPADHPLCAVTRNSFLSRS